MRMTFRQWCASFFRPAPPKPRRPRREPGRPKVAWVVVTNGQRSGTHVMAHTRSEARAIVKRQLLKSRHGRLPLGIRLERADAATAAA